MKYRKSITAKKGGKEFAYAAGASTVATVVIEVARGRGYLPWGPEQDVKIIGVLFAALVGGLKALRNWVKERRRRRRREERGRNLDRFKG